MSDTKVNFITGACLLLWLACEYVEYYVRVFW